jgi:nucleotide-binding universal stress UspA family protein
MFLSTTMIMIIKKGAIRMKILVCMDGSENSKKTLEKACEIAKGCTVNEVGVIHVFDNRQDLSSLPRDGSPVTEKDMEKFRNLIARHKEERKKILSDALECFERENINARAILKEGHPAHTITKVASEEGFDMIILGSRGMSGLRKVLLGSVSNAVIQEASNCTVVVVK